MSAVVITKGTHMSRRVAGWHGQGEASSAHQRSLGCLERGRGGGAEEGKEGEVWLTAGCFAAAQASSVDFLMQHGFSFDRCFGKGITSLPLDLAPRVAAAAPPPSPPAATSWGRLAITSERDREFVADLRASLRTLLAGEMASAELATPNSYFRRVAYQEVGDLQREGHGLHVEKAPGGVNLLVMKASAEEKAARQAAEAGRRAREAEEAVGFSRVLEMVGRCGLPLVGHNMMLDLAYTMESFVGALPLEWPDFRASVAAFFRGGIYDTKYLAAQLPGFVFPDGTALGAVRDPLPSFLCPLFFQKKERN